MYDLQYSIQVDAWNNKQIFPVDTYFKVFD